MTHATRLTAAALAAGIGGLIVPALAQNRSGAGTLPDQGHEHAAWATA